MSVHGNPNPTESEALMAIIQTVVVLSVPRSVAAVLVLSKAVLQAVTANKTTFPSPTPTVAQFGSDISALDTAETAVKTKTVGTVPVRNEKLAMVVADLRQLRAYVQLIANATPEQAESIAASAGMTVRKPVVRNKSDLAAKTTVSGSVKLVAKATAGSHAHEWQYSLDGKTWVNAPSSLQAKTTISNLQTNVLTYFRHCAVSKAGPGNWSQPISLLVA
jgi:hypothetical protein